jgi:hypothetical protein
MGLLALAWLTGCAVKPVESPSAAARDECAAPNPLHMVASSSPAPKPEVDPEIEALLAQRPGDPRLLQINRQMYQALHALDAQIRAEQRIAACKQAAFEDSTLQARSTAPADHAESSALNPGSVPNALSASSTVTAPSAASLSSIAASGTVKAAGAQSSASRKTNVSANAAGGNGATAPKIVPGNDDDIVARRLRTVAEEETNPTLRAKLWKEYMDYRQGTGVAK